MAGKQDSMTGNASAIGVPENVRQAAETTLAQARQAIDQYLHQATGIREKVEASVQAAQAGARDINRNVLAAAEANMNATFDFAQQLVRATNPQEIATLQQNFLRQQIERMSVQMQEMGPPPSAPAGTGTGTPPKG
jgi:phasin